MGTRIKNFNKLQIRKMYRIDPNIKTHLKKRGRPTLSHGNSYVFYEVANSYEFVRPHSYDFVRFV